MCFIVKFGRAQAQVKPLIHFNSKWSSTTKTDVLNNLTSVRVTPGPLRLQIPDFVDGCHLDTKESIIGDTQGRDK